jgi:tetratricopeptide (TPR) repeat protein
VLVAVLALTARGAGAGEQVMAEFKNARAVTPEVLRNVRDKGVVAELLDPGDTGLGKSVSYLLWREVLTAISDQAGAGVIVAEAPPGERLVDLIEQDYHEAALRIAANQQARLALWGAVDAEGDRLFVDTYLSVLTGGRASDLHLRLGARVPGAPPDEARKIQEAASMFEARLARPRFGLATVEIARAELFERPLIAEGTLLLRERPAADAPVLLRVPPGSVLQAVDMEGGWFKVRLADRRLGYLPAGRQEGSSGLVALRVPPKWVEANATGVVLRGGPGRDATSLGTRDLRGRFRVLDMRYRTGQGLWYRIALDERGGDRWVAGVVVRPRFSLPAVHLMAGFYRYYAERFPDAAAEFQRFLDTPGVAESPANRAAVQQLLGASLLPDGQTKPAWQAFTKAIELTPYDPDVYMVRSVACVGLGRAETALDDVTQALELDPRNARARAFAWSIAEVADGRAHPLLQELSHLGAQRARSAEIVRRYGIQRPD